MPYNFSKKKKNNRKKRIFFGAVSIIVVIIVVLTIVLNISTKPNYEKYLKEKDYYFVYVDKNQKQAVLSAQSETIRSLGGAGKIVSHENSYYLVASVYLTEADAQEIVSNIVKNFPNAGTFKVSKRFTKAQKRELSTNPSYLKCSKFINDLIEELQTNSMKYLAGTISESALSSNILIKKHELESLKKDFEETDEFSKKILAFEELCLLHITNFCNEFFTNSKKQALLSELVMNLVMAECDLIDNL